MKITRAENCAKHMNTFITQNAKLVNLKVASTCDYHCFWRTGMAARTYIMYRHSTLHYLTRQACYECKETVDILTHHFRYKSFIPESEMEVFEELGTWILHPGVWSAECSLAYFTFFCFDILRNCLVYQTVRLKLTVVHMYLVLRAL
jgi:hypothetical protein